MLLDINGLRENYRLLMNAKVNSQGKPLGLVADTRGELFRSTSAWGWWLRILGGLSKDETLRIAVEKTYRALESIPRITLELGRSGNIDEKLGFLKVFTRVPEQIVSHDKHQIDPFIWLVQHIRHFWVGDTSENKELVTTTNKFAQIAQWLPQANLLVACQRIASEEVQSALEAYQKLTKTPPFPKTERDETEETVRLDLVNSQQTIIEEQVLLIEALRAQLAAHSRTPTSADIGSLTVPDEEMSQKEAFQDTMSDFEAAVRTEVKRLEQLVTKIEERRGFVKEELPAPLTMAANLGGKIGGGSSKHDVIVQLAQLNKRLAYLINVVAEWDPEIDSSCQRIAELESEIDRLSESLLKATDPLARQKEHKP